MKILKPFYYDDFKCVANNCIDSCCIGWTVTIDKKTYNKYRKIKGEFGKSLNDSISRVRKNSDNLMYGKMKLNNYMCNMLDEEKLCKVHINLGEDFLCNICKVYPRIIRKYGNIYERMLTMSCPEVARYLVVTKDEFSFVMEDEKLSDLDKEYINDVKHNDKLYELIWSGRSLCMEVAQFNEIEIWKRIIFIKIICNKIQNRIDEKNYEEVDNFLNNLRDQITNINLINSLDNVQSSPELKSNLIHSIIQSTVNARISNEKFINMINDYNEIIKENSDSENVFQSIIESEKEFNIFLREYDNILENLLIYLLYKHFMNAINSKDLNKEINNVIISYVVIKILLLVRWYKNDKKLKEEDWVEVFYLFSRAVEHKENYLDELYRSMKNLGYDKLSYLTIMVR